MKVMERTTRVTLKNILFATDFSEPSEAALPFAMAVARQYGSKLFALHVMTPQPFAYGAPDLGPSSMAAYEDALQAEMQRVEARLTGLPHETLMVREASVWRAFERAIKEHKIDLAVVGTHGRTGVSKLLMGSQAEEIFRRCKVPVLTIGPAVRIGVHGGGKFHCVLFATDFTPTSLGAAPYAISLAQENQANLLLLYVVPEKELRKSGSDLERAVPEIRQSLEQLVPKDADLWCRPEVAVEYGSPAERILEAAKQRGADLIVLGVRSAHGHLSAATHLEGTTAHKVVAHAVCPVLTVRG
jgi:nucleotide-binding universal stress UspA family protein